MNGRRKQVGSNFAAHIVRRASPRVEPWTTRHATDRTIGTAARSMRMERAIPKVLAIALRPRHRSRAPRASCVFWASDLDRFLEDLVFHGLSAQHPLQIAKALFELAHVRSGNNIFVGLHSGMTAFEHATLPGKQLGRRNARLPGNVGHAHAGLHGLFNHADLLGHRPASTALH